MCYLSIQNALQIELAFRHACVLRSDLKGVGEFVGMSSFKSDSFG